MRICSCRFETLSQGGTAPKRHTQGDTQCTISAAKVHQIALQTKKIPNFLTLNQQKRLKVHHFVPLFKSFGVLTWVRLRELRHQRTTAKQVKNREKP